MLKRAWVLLILFISTLSLSAQLKRFEHNAENPGDLAFFYYIPKSLKSATEAPLVVVLHGCSQDAVSINELAGWTGEADEFGFMLLFAEQKKLNNVGDCFNWFLPLDVEPRSGEMASVHSAMMAFREKHPGKRNFIYGVSAGAAMSLALLYNYPLDFEAGAVVAGGEFKYHESVFSAGRFMQEATNLPLDVVLGFLPERIRLNQGPYPLLVSIHGTADPVVHVAHQTEIKKQYLSWSRNDTLSEMAEAPLQRISRRQYNNLSQQKQLVLYTVEGMGHAVPVDHSGKNRLGGGGIFAAKIDWFSTRAILTEWGLVPQ